MSTFRYVVTFEFDDQAPETVRGEIVAGKAETAARRALTAAKAQRPYTHARSIVILLELLAKAIEEAELPPHHLGRSGWEETDEP